MAAVSASLTALSQNSFNANHELASQAETLFAVRLTLDLKTANLPEQGTYLKSIILSRKVYGRLFKPKKLVSCGMGK